MTQRTGLIVIDMLNRYEHEDADSLRGSVRTILPKLLPAPAYREDGRRATRL